MSFVLEDRAGSLRCGRLRGDLPPGAAGYILANAPRAPEHPSRNVVWPC